MCGMVVGLLLGGHLDRWNRVRFDGLPTAVGALVIQLVLFNPPLEQQPWAMVCGPWIYVASMAAVASVLLVNARRNARLGCRLGLAIAAVGVLLNCAAVTANAGYMPRQAESDGTTVVLPLAAGRLVNVTPLAADTRLPWLGDVIVEPDWLPLANVISIGDLLLSGGLTAWAFQVTTGGVRRRRPEPGIV
jgi:hypothetical protein